MKITWYTVNELPNGELEIRKYSYIKNFKIKLPIALKEAIKYYGERKEISVLNKLERQIKKLKQ